MSNKTTKLACGLLACSLTFSLAAPVFAEEVAQTPATYTDEVTPETKDVTTTVETTVPTAKVAADTVISKSDVSFVKDAATAPADFVTITDANAKPVLSYKAGTEATTVKAGTFSTTVIATFDDATTQEVVASYTVTEPVKTPVKAAALATAKSNVTTEINVAAKDPSKFVTASAGVTLSFVKAPVVNRLGAQTVTVAATDGTTTENISATYTVVDTTKPVIEAIEDDFYVGIDEDWTADELVDATDNSGFVKVYFENGKEFLDTSKEGNFTTVIVAEDASGNTSSITLSYEVLGDDVYFFDAPVVNVSKSTKLDIYGKAEPLTTVMIFDEDGNIIGEDQANDEGDFHIRFDKADALVNGQTIYLWSVDMETGEYSDVSEFTYVGEELKVEPADTNTKPAVVQAVKKATVKAATPAKTTNLKALPKTGDSSSAGLVFAGLLVSGIAAALLRKRG
ncbi:cell wall anchor domain-containing protein [Listeria weihenstephanensis FSL R9-0317]|uniref:LPXTG cell wall anchor domain-containing protein n=1 Tax=Listeria weihenstephanensis TaxID=1006155 RepID=UPI0003E85F0D|nr:LPXTG cell wall anchor domain-containing protein [Listeria weihenstephanensis]EUJ40858.1 cell wall anchor domain-containing protein [Listeria weihenstephanensis FSL R9-0317]